MEQRYSQSFESIRAGEPAGDLLRKAAGVAPTPRQLAWQRLELTAFIHFGMNTFTDREWGDGAESPQLFNPTDLDADQWVRVLKDAGFKGLILTCKHHDGFCLWPSAHTTHSVKQSPWKNGGGDVVREVSDACRRAGLRFGIYLSPWDRHDPRYGDSPAYNAFFLAQLEELLTGYGEIFEVWFDGACAEGPCGKRQEYDWAAYFALIRRLQPDAVISIEGPDVRWVGNEAGKGRREEWSVYPYGRRLDAEDGTFLMNAGDCTAPDLGSDRLLASLDEGWEYLYWYPAQVDTSIRPGWFYHTWEDDKVKPLHELAAIYRQSVGNNAQLLLNIPPDTRGRLSDKDAARLEEFGRYLRAAYGRNLAEGRPLEVRRDGDAYVVSLTLDEPVAFNQAVLMEDITQGQHVGAFTLRAYCGDELTASADGATVGYKKSFPCPRPLPTGWISSSPPAGPRRCSPSWACMTRPPWRSLPPLPAARRAWSPSRPVRTRASAGRWTAAPGGTIPAPSLFPAAAGSGPKPGTTRPACLARTARPPKRCSACSRPPGR